VNPSLLVKATGCAPDVAARWVGPLTAAAAEFEITMPKRFAAFVAVVAQESGDFRYVRELGSHDYLSRYDVGALAMRLGNTPEADGDGELYCGRGLIQITGRTNYVACAAALCLPLIDHPELLEQTENAARSAAWYFRRHGCNHFADIGDFLAISIAVNGKMPDGYPRDWPRRKARWDLALKAFTGASV
jgi:putative chitinase